MWSQGPRSSIITSYWQRANSLVEVFSTAAWLVQGIFMGLLWHQCFFTSVFLSFKAHINNCCPDRWKKRERMFRQEANKIRELGRRGQRKRALFWAFGNDETWRLCPQRLRVAGGGGLGSVRHRKRKGRSESIMHQIRKIHNLSLQQARNLHPTEPHPHKKPKTSHGAEQTVRAPAAANGQNWYANIFQKLKSWITQANEAATLELLGLWIITVNFLLLT